MAEPNIAAALETIMTRLDTIDGRLAALVRTRKKTLEWMAQLSEQVTSLDAFREEVRASLEPLFCKLEGLDDLLRILRHATSDVSRRVESLEGERRAQAS